MLAKDEALGYLSNSVIAPPPPRETAAEADHRIANSLMLVASLLRLQAKELAKQPFVTGPELKNALDDAAARVDAVSQLHRLLASSPDPQSIDSAEYLRRIGDAAERIGASGTPITLRYDLADNLPMDPRRLVALGMLTSEAIINALKHAHPSGVAGEISVAFRRIGGDYVLVVEDDGVGLPDGFNPATDGGLGFKTMRQLALQLKARLDHQSTPLGLRTEVFFAL